MTTTALFEPAAVADDATSWPGHYRHQYAQATAALCVEEEAPS
jgi:hypothetical protein